MIIGRDKEQRELHEAYESEYSEFAVVYGRRRVGKTFLVAMRNSRLSQMIFGKSICRIHDVVNWRNENCRSAT